MRLPISNWHPISHRFEVIADYSANFRRETVTLRFSAIIWRLRGTYTVHLRLIGKRVMYFLLVIIELFSLSVTGKVLRGSESDLKSAFWKGYVPINHFARIDRPMNA